MIFDGRKLTTLVMFLLFAGACALSVPLPAKAAFMPVLVGVPGALLCFAQLMIDIRADLAERRKAEASGRPPGDEVDETPENGKSELEMFVWLALFTGALLGFGFVIGGPIIVTAFVRFSSRDSWQNALFAGAGTFAVIYGVFIWMLELSLFHGLILEAIFG